MRSLLRDGKNRRCFDTPPISPADSFVCGLAAASHYGESLLVDEPSSDQLGQILPRRLLGRTGEKVTMLGLGGFHVGFLNDREAQAMIEAAIAGGIRFFDNAQQYQGGGSEAKYGRFLTPKYREHVFLMTKTLARDASSAERDLEGSLRRLKTDHLDLWQMHSAESPADVDRRQQDGVFQVMAAAKKSGKTRYIGFTGHRTPDAHRRVLERTDQFDTCQMPVNAADPSYQSFIGNVLPLAAEKNLGVLAMKTLADRGFFGTNRWDRPTHGCLTTDSQPDQRQGSDTLRLVFSDLCLNQRLRNSWPTPGKDRAGALL